MKIPTLTSRTLFHNRGCIDQGYVLDHFDKHPEYEMELDKALRGLLAIPGQITTIGDAHEQKGLTVPLRESVTIGINNMGAVVASIDDKYTRFVVNYRLKSRVRCILKARNDDRNRDQRLFKVIYRQAIDAIDDGFVHPR